MEALRDQVIDISVYWGRSVLVSGPGGTGVGTKERCEIKVSSCPTRTSQARVTRTGLFEEGKNVRGASEKFVGEPTKEWGCKSKLSLLFVPLNLGDDQLYIFVVVGFPDHPEHLKR